MLVNAVDRGDRHLSAKIALKEGMQVIKTINSVNKDMRERMKNFPPATIPHIERDKQSLNIQMRSRRNRGGQAAPHSPSIVIPPRYLLHYTTICSKSLTSGKPVWVACFGIQCMSPAKVSAIMAKVNYADVEHN